MHVQTHVLAGWCMGNGVPLSAGERVKCMVAASAADVDGLSIVGGQEAYWNWHHTVGHNLPFGVLLSALLAGFSRRRIGGRFALFLLYLGLFHLHLFMDYWGSGPEWHIHYLWPMQYRWPAAQWVWRNPNGWEFYSWQNMVAALAMVAWTLLIAVRQRRTPLEAMMPSLDRQLVRWLRRDPLDRSA